MRFVNPSYTPPPDPAATKPDLTRAEITTLIPIIRTALSQPRTVQSLSDLLHSDANLSATIKAKLSGPRIEAILGEIIARGEAKVIVD